MKKLIAFVFTFSLALALSMPAFAQTAGKQSTKEHVYYGDISDSNCGAHHKMADNPQECTLACIKHGAKYVFVGRGGKVSMIENQNMPELEKYAGEHVRITGAKTAGGKAVAISTIRAARRRTKKAKA